MSRVAMDHLILPPGGIAPPITVLYSASKDKYYDELGFFNYPTRMGWSENHLHGDDGFCHRSKEDVEIFFQTWLYFGFVVEVFKAVGISVTTEDFLTCRSFSKSPLSLPQSFPPSSRSGRPFGLYPKEYLQTAIARATWSL